MIYFNKIQSSLLEGFKAGIIFVITGIVLDCIITIPLFTNNWNFLADKFILLGYLEGIIIVSLMGYILEKLYTNPQKGQAHFLDTIRGAD